MLLFSEKLNQNRFCSIFSNFRTDFAHFTQKKSNANRITLFALLQQLLTL